MQKSTNGFTIVELLIVIVVIAVLAAITIVTYNGVQTRANNTKTITAVTNWAKAIKMYIAQTGTYPTSGQSCLGDASTYSDNSGKCWSSGTFVVDSAFLSNINMVMSSYPQPSVQKVYFDATNFIEGGRFDGGTKHIYYVLSGTGTCPNIIGIQNDYLSAYAGGVQCGFPL